MFFQPGILSFLKEGESMPKSKSNVTNYSTSKTRIIHVKRGLRNTKGEAGHHDVQRLPRCPTGDQCIGEMESARAECARTCWSSQYSNTYLHAALQMSIYFHQCCPTNLVQLQFGNILLLPKDCSITKKKINEQHFFYVAFP